jgi:hypothetical protein
MVPGHKRMPKRHRCRLGVEILEERTVPSTVSWNVDVSGDWNVASNWSTNQIPQPGEDVVINRAVPVTVTLGSGAQQVNSVTCDGGEILALNGGSLTSTTGFTVSSGGELDVAGGTLASAGTLTNSGTANWTSGTISGSGSGLTLAGTLSISGTNNVFLSGTLNNTGTITQAAASSNNTLVFNSGAVLNNSGLYDIQENGQAMVNNGGSGWAFNNSGTLQKSGPATFGTAYLGNVPFNNAAAGAVTVTSGILSLSGGGADLGGNFTANTGGVLDLTGGTSPHLAGAYTGSGTGTVVLSSGNLIIDAAGATFNFPANLFQSTGGTITATAGHLTNAATGYMTLSGTGASYLNGTLDNIGTITQVAASSFNTLYFQDGAVLNNSGLYDIQENGTALQTNGGSAWAFNNSGTFQKSGPATAGTATVGSVPFNNAASGIVNVTSGVLSLSGGGTDLGGAFTVASGDTLDLAGGSSPTLTGGYTGSGDGAVSLASGALVIGASGATFNFPQNFFQWTGGTINAAAGALTNSATGFMTLNGTGNLFLGGTLNNVGTITQVGVGGSYNSLEFLNGAVLNNSGLYDIQQIGLLAPDGGSFWAFNNSGTIQKSGGTGYASLTLPFNNAATALVNVTAGGLSLAGGGTYLGGTFTVSGGATLALSSGGGAVPTLTGTYTGSGGGTVTMNGNNLAIGAAGATFNFPQNFFQWTNSGIDASSGALTNAATGYMTLSGTGNLFLAGTLNNLGTITQVAPSSFNTLYFQDGAVLNNSGLYDIQENGTAMQTNGGSAWALNNSGTLQKSGPAANGAAMVFVPVNNAAAGIVNVTTGILSLLGGGTDLGGNFTVSSDAILNIPGGGAGPTLTGTYTGAGGGAVFVGGGTLTIGAAGATFNFPQGLFQWTGGVIDASAGALTNAATGFMTLSGTGNLYLLGTLDNLGAMTQVAPSSFNTLYFNDGAMLNNSGLYDIQENGTALQTNGGSVWAFNNSGTLRKSGPATAGTAFFGSVPFNNAANGIVDVTSGALVLSGGGADLGGTFTVSGGATLDLTGGASPTLTGTYTGSGGGTVSLASGTLTIGAAGATFNFPQNFFQWTGGYINAAAGTLTNAATSFLTLSGTGNLYLSGTLDNVGAITQAADSSNNTLYFLNVAVLNNSGSYDVQENGLAMQTFGGSGQAFNNPGTFQKSGPATPGTAIVNIPFNLTGGTINVPAGTLTLEGGGTSTGGNYDVATDASVNYAGGTHTFSGAYTGSGAGVVVLSNGNISIPGNAFFDLSGGGFDINGGFLFVSGTVTNAGIFGVLSTSTITGSWNNSGSLLLYQNTNLGNAGAVIDNTGVIGLQPGVTLAVTGASLTNEIGALISGGGTLNTTAVTFTNNGIVDLNLPSVFDLELHSSSIQVTYVFSGSMNASTVTNPANFGILASGGDGIFGNGNDVNESGLISGITYDSATGVATINLSQNLPADVFRISINGDAVQDTAGNPLYPSGAIIVDRGTAPTLSSVVVNGGTPQYHDAFGDGPAIDISHQNSVVLQILVTFSEPVTLAPGAFSIIPFAISTDGNVHPGQVLVNSGPNPNQAEVDLNAPVQVGVGRQWIVTFANSPGTHPNGYGAYVIDDGVYTLHIDHTKVQLNGLNLAADNDTGFWALYGDTTFHSISGVDFNVGTGYVGDGYSDASVGNADFQAFKACYNSDSTNDYAPPNYNVKFDANLDGSVSNSDFVHFKTNYNTDWQF